MHKNSHAARPHLATRVKHLDPAIRKASSDFSTPSSQLFHNGTSSSYWPFQSSVSAPLGYCWRPIRAMNFWWCFPFFFSCINCPRHRKTHRFFLIVFSLVEATEDARGIMQGGSWLSGWLFFSVRSFYGFGQVITEKEQQTQKSNKSLVQLSFFPSFYCIFFGFFRSIVPSVQC